MGNARTALISRFTFLVLLLICATTLSAAGTQLRLVIIGDSTVCKYPLEHTCRGWGQYIQDYFEDTVQVINLAKSGRSTKTFIKEGLWGKTLEARPDILLIQFGHNDSHAPDKPESTDATTDFQDYLRQYIDEARADTHPCDTGTAQNLQFKWQVE